MDEIIKQDVIAKFREEVGPNVADVETLADALTRALDRAFQVPNAPHWLMNDMTLHVMSVKVEAGGSLKAEEQKLLIQQIVQHRNWLLALAAFRSTPKPETQPRRGSGLLGAIAVQGGLLLGGLAAFASDLV